jgi:DNA-binding NtrC family response regulator
MRTASTLMLVDDDEITRRIMYAMLVDRGYSKVIETGDGATALDFFKTNSVDLLITDIRRPGMDGVALIHAVREIDPDIRVIVVSGAPEDTVRCLLESYSSIHFLQKPVDWRKFLATVADVLAADSSKP